METKHTCFGMVKGGDCEELTKQNPNLFGSSGWTKKKRERIHWVRQKKPIRFRDYENVYGYKYPILNSL